MHGGDNLQGLPRWLERWLRHQITHYPQLHDGQQQLLAELGLTVAEAERFDAWPGRRRPAADGLALALAYAYAVRHGHGDDHAYLIPMAKSCSIRSGVSVAARVRCLPTHAPSGSNTVRPVFCTQRTVRLHCETSVVHADL